MPTMWRWIWTTRSKLHWRLTVAMWPRLIVLTAREISLENRKFSIIWSNLVIFISVLTNSFESYLANELGTPIFATANEVFRADWLIIHRLFTSIGHWHSVDNDKCNWTRSTQEKIHQKPPRKWLWTVQENKSWKFIWRNFDIRC